MLARNEESERRQIDLQRRDPPVASEVDRTIPWLGQQAASLQRLKRLVEVHPRRNLALLPKTEKDGHREHQE